MFDVLYEKISVKSDISENKIGPINIIDSAALDKFEFNKSDLRTLMDERLIEIADLHKYIDKNLDNVLIARYKDELSKLELSLNTLNAKDKLKLFYSTKSNAVEIIKSFYGEIYGFFYVHDQNCQIIEKFILMLGNTEFMELKKSKDETRDVLKSVIDDSINFSNNVLNLIYKNINTQNNNLGNVLTITEYLKMIKDNIESRKLLLKSQFDIYHKIFKRLCEETTADSRNIEMSLGILEIAKTDVVLRLNKIYIFIDDIWEQKLAYYEHFANIYILMLQIRKTPLLVQSKYPLIYSDNLYNDDQLKNQLISMFTSFIDAYKNTANLYKDVFETNHLN
ncbi:hypothetical protein COBT_001549 [Conglomerata obtusa]